MLVLIDLFIFEVIVAPELGVASSHGVGGFQQVVAKETIAGLDEFPVLGFKLPGLVLGPDEAGEFGHRRLGSKAMDVTDFGDDTGGVDLADAWDGSQRVGDDFELLLNSLVQNLDLLFQGPHGGDRNGHRLVHRVVYSDRQAIGISGSGLDRLGFGGRISEVAALFINERRQLIQISESQFVHGFKSFHERKSGGAGVCYVLILGDTRAFQKQIVR